MIRCSRESVPEEGSGFMFSNINAVYRFGFRTGGKAIFSFNPPAKTEA